MEPMNNGTPYEMSVGRTVIAFSQIERMLDYIVGVAINYGGFPRPNGPYPRLLGAKIKFVKSAFAGCDLLVPFAAGGEHLLARVLEAADDRNWLVHAAEIDAPGRGLHLEMLKFAELRYERVQRKLTSKDLLAIPERAQRLNSELGDFVSEIIDAASRSNR